MRWMKSYYLVGVFIATLLTIALHITDNLHITNTKIVFNILEEQNLVSSKKQEAQQHKTAVVGNDSVTGCDLFSGRWVFDNATYPLYEEAQCSFMRAEFACQRFGRNNLKYQHWAWKPHHCDLPRFDGKKLMEKIRGKRVVFVGDSLNRNQWTSMLCLIESSLHESSSQKSIVRKDNLFVFYATEYNATIEFYWSPLLVESNVDDPNNHSIKSVVLRINSIEKHARHWTDADILIFDNFSWWIYDMTLLWGSFGSPEAIQKAVKKNPRLYEMSLNTWSEWVEINVNPIKTKLFFMSLSPYHYNGEHFDGRGCYGETEPVLKEDYWGAQTDREMMRRAEAVIERLEERGVKVQYLNITHLSDYRKDAHISSYKRFIHPKTKEQFAQNPLLADCVHWCLPGVPDVWNIFLYHYIVNN